MCPADLLLMHLIHSRWLYTEERRAAIMLDPIYLMENICDRKYYSGFSDEIQKNISISRPLESKSCFGTLCC